MKNVGTVIVDLANEANIAEIRRVALHGMRSTPEGRVLSVAYSVPKAWIVSKPIESIVARAVLGSPKSRTPESEWSFFGNLGVRVCRGNEHSRSIETELIVLMFRREGPKAFERRHDTSKMVVEQSLIGVSHPVFTRDVANNVWHLPLKGYKTQLRQRLSMLFSWADESTLLITPNSQNAFAHSAANLDRALVGVPTKVPYDWYPVNSLLGRV